MSTLAEDSFNAGTVYKRRIYNNSITADAMVGSDDYELLEDGSLKIPLMVLEEAKEKDTIYIMFKDEVNKPILPFKIIGDGFDNCFVCELVI